MFVLVARGSARCSLVPFFPLPLALVAAIWLGMGSTAAAQLSLPSVQPPDATNPFLGGVPHGEATPPAFPLTLKDAIARGLDNNLGVLLQEHGVTAARGSRWQALEDLLPDVSARVGGARRQSSLAEFGFTSFPGIESTVIGPFNVFDTRLRVSQPVLDLSALYGAHAASSAVRAAQHDVQNARDLVVLVVANLYLTTIAAGSRVDAVRAELDTADTLFRLSTDMRQAGLAAGIDVLRAQLQQQVAKQRLIAAENDVAKARLQLGRAIGLPSGQEIRLVDRLPYAPLDGIPVTEALKQAYASRADYLAQSALVQAAEDTRKSAHASLLPSVSVDAEVGRVGVSPSTTDLTYSVAASVTVPIFERGRAQARSLQSEAQLQQRRATLADLRARIDVEVRSALLDLQSATQAIDAARAGVDLAAQQLTQSKDRFAAGVAGSVDVVQAQEAVARANDQYVTALHAHNLAKASLARAVGVAEERTQQYLGGTGATGAGSGK